MQLVRFSSRKKPLIIIITGVSVLFIALGIYLYAFNGTILGWSPLLKEQSKDQVDYNKPTKEQLDAGKDIKKNSVENKSHTSGSDQPTPPQPQPNGKSVVEVAFSAIAQVESTLQLRTLISAVDTGTCTLTMEKSGRTPVVKSAETQTGPSTSTCMGFNIPVSELTPGDWSATLVYESPTLKGAVNKVINIK